MRPTLWLVSPVYHDVEAYLMLRERLEETIKQELHDVCDRIRYIVVDDSAGADERIDGLRRTSGVDVIEAPFNLGHQRALVYALRAILPSLDEGDLVVTLDADGEDRPEDLPRLLQPLLDDPSDRRRITLARRTRRQTSFSFKVLYFFFTLLFRFLTGASVRTGNYAAYRAWLARRMLEHPYFDLCYSSSLLVINREIVFVPCPKGERYAGHSRMGPSRLAMHGIRMMMPFADRVALRALTLFSVTFALGVLLALVLGAIRLTTDVAIPGWASVTVVVVLVLSFVSLGNFITLFAVFSQSLGISLSPIDRERFRGRSEATIGRAAGSGERPVPDRRSVP